MIRNARIHIEGALPVMADLRALPEASDVSVSCTNMRTTDGKRPTFIEHGQSWFVIPLAVVRFVEMPPDALGLSSLPEAASGAESDTHGEDVGPAAQDALDFEPDEAFLQRIRDI